MRQKLSILANTPQGEMSIGVEHVIIYPDRVWQKLAMPMGEMTIVFTPAASFVATPMGSQDMPASQRDDALTEIKRNPFFVAQHADDPKFAFSAGASEKVGEVETKILDVNADGAEVRWFVDPQSGRILRAVWKSVGPAGPGEMVVEYADWKSVASFTLPFKETRTSGGEKQATVELKEVEFNPSVDPKLFEKPAAKAGEKSP
jgi:hypothetical protein